MNRFLWVLQIFFGLSFVAIGVTHFVVPTGLPDLMSWMYELPTTLHVTAGIAEVLGGLGLILPGLTKIRTELTALAATGLGAVMIGAVIWHAGRGEASQIVTNVILAAAMGFIAYSRWRVTPLPAKT